jgi:hypothetical protein
VSLELLLVIAAVVVLALLAVMRVVRAGRGLAPRPAGIRWLLMLLAFVVVLPVAIDVLTHGGGADGQLHPIGSLLLFIGWLLLFVILMGIAALLVAWIAPPRSRPTLLLALIGREKDAQGIPYDPALSPAAAAAVTRVEQLNAAFPRGRGFVLAVDRPDFAARWAEFDAATRDLEAVIAEGTRTGTGVAQNAIEVAADARSRIDALRRDAERRGMVLAV